MDLGFVCVFFSHGIQQFILFVFRNNIQLVFFTQFSTLLSLQEFVDLNARNLVFVRRRISASRVSRGHLFQFTDGLYFTSTHAQRTDPRVRVAHAGIR